MASFKEGANEMSNIFLGGTHIATMDSSGAVTFFHANHLGSRHIVTDAEGAILVKTTYEPYGGIHNEERFDSSDETMWFYFTGKQLDEETGLYYYGAKIHPLIIRYLIVQKTIIETMGDRHCGRFVDGQYRHFTALGSQNKTHVALFLVARVSYYDS